MRSRLRLWATVLLLVLVGTTAAPTSAHAGGSGSDVHASPASAAPIRPTDGSARAGDPRRTRGLFVDPRMKAAQAGAAFSAIGRKAQPLWITDYYDDPAAATRDYVTRAERAGKTPLLVVYNIPDRDCGLYSSQDDQVTDAEYRRFVRGVAAGLKGTAPILILEPDAVPFIGNPACTGQGDRLALLRDAVTVLTKAGAWVYLDAGHSGWQTPAHMAPLLAKAGVATARGIATNVANTRATVDEKTYATAVIRELKARRITDVRYVMDTSRNGAGRNGPENGDVCNPVDARLGLPPQLRFQGAFDGRLWVKLPGESDGPCNGGPGSGEFFPTGACRLLGTASSYYDSGSRTCCS